MCSMNKIKKLIKQFDVNIDRYEVAKYKVTETSDRHGEHSYIVHNIGAEYEDGGVYFGDIENIIFDNQYALMGFLVESVKDVTVTDKLIDIVFEFNSIKIELLV